MSVKLLRLPTSWQSNEAYATSWHYVVLSRFVKPLNIFVRCAVRIGALLLQIFCITLSNVTRMILGTSQPCNQSRKEFAVFRMH